VDHPAGTIDAMYRSSHAAECRNAAIVQNIRKQAFKPVVCDSMDCIIKRKKRGREKIINMPFWFPVMADGYRDMTHKAF